MKSKLIFLAACLLLVTVTAAMAQPTPRRPVATQAPGTPAFVPQNPTPGFDPGPAMPGPVMVDPATGLPPEPQHQWIDPNWSDPSLVITNLAWDGLPISEIASQLREDFKNHFDILPMPNAFGTDWGSTQIKLQLKQVRASDIFNAMNLVFENDRTPLRWELRANGNRPIVLLRVLPEAAPEAPAHIRPPETRRMVYFIGNLTDPEKTGGTSRDRIYKTILESWPEDLGNRDGVIQFHDEAQLLVVNGTRDQIDFVHQILSALQEKATWERSKPRPAGGGSN